MQVIHISQTQKESGYEIAELLANRYSKRNSFLVIKINEEIYLSGGHIIEDTPLNRKVLDSIPRNEQWDFVKGFKTHPFIKSYYDENDLPIYCENYNDNKHKSLKDVDFGELFKPWHKLRIVLWSLNPNRKRINKFYSNLDLGKSVLLSYYDALNA